MPKPVDKVLFSRSGQWCIRVEKDGSPVVQSLGPAPTSNRVPSPRKWKSLLQPQECEIHYQDSRFFLSDDGNTIVRVPYIWRWDESGFADEYPMLVIYDIAKDKVTEQIVRMGHKAKVADLAWIDGQIWMHLIVERANKRIEQAITDLKGSTTYVIKPDQRPEEPLLWDVESQNLVRVEPIEAGNLPEQSAIEIHDYRKGTAIKCAIAFASK